MPAPDFWTMEAEAMELTLAGTRLVVREITDTVKDVCYTAKARLLGYVRWTVTAGKGGNDTVA
jgi:hypothetical protein